MGYVERGWELIGDFYNWLLDENFSEFESGNFCKYIATFFDLYLKKFFFEDVELENITKDIVKGYLGYWYPMNANFGSVEDIKFQIKSFTIFSRFIGFKKGNDSDELISFLNGKDKIINRFKSYKKIERENIDFKKFEEDLKKWLEEKW